MDEPDDFGVDERNALAAWHVPDAPAGLVQQAMARAARRRALVRGVWLAAAVVALAAGVGATWWALRDAAVSGSIAATTRTEARLGSRGVVVAEPGSLVEWSVDADGQAHVEQARGAVFYRVEPGGDFVVRTPGGQVRVRGTCFSVLISEEDAMRSGVAGGVGGLMGAGAATLVMVIVYEGRVEVRALDGVAREVASGERAEIGAGGLITVREIRSSPGVPPSSTTDEIGKALPAPSVTATEPVVGEATCPAALASRERDLQALEAKVGALEARVAEAQAAGAALKSYGLSQAQLRAMADRCELAWDTIPLRLGEPITLPTETAERFSLDEAQVALINKAIAEESAAVIAGIRAAYVEATGDDPAAILAVAPGALVEEIQDKTPLEEKRRVYRLLAEERAAAGIAADARTVSAFERVMRLLTTSGDRLESKLAESFGHEAAREMRDAHDGFGNVSRASYGCPSEGGE